MSVRRDLGFSLVELMIVLAVIGILAAIALPNYRDYLVKARRSDAQQLMTDAANREKQYLLDARAYTADLSSAGLSLAKEGWTCTAANCSNAYYVLTITVVNTATPPTFSIRATAQGDQTSDGDYMTLSSTGSRVRHKGGADIPW